MTEYTPQLEYWLLPIQDTKLYYNPWGKTKAERFSTYPITFSTAKDATWHLNHIRGDRLLDPSLPDVRLQHVRCEVILREMVTPELPVRYVLAVRALAPILAIYKTKKAGKEACAAIRSTIESHYTDQHYAYYDPDWQKAKKVGKILGERGYHGGYGGLIATPADLMEVRLSLKDDKDFPKVLIDLVAL